MAQHVISKRLYPPLNHRCGQRQRGYVNKHEPKWLKIAVTLIDCQKLDRDVWLACGTKTKRSICWGCSARFRSCLPKQISPAPTLLLPPSYSFPLSPCLSLSGRQPGDLWSHSGFSAVSLQEELSADHLQLHGQRLNTNKTTATQAVSHTPWSVGEQRANMSDTTSITEYSGTHQAFHDHWAKTDDDMCLHSMSFHLHDALREEFFSSYLHLLEQIPLGKRWRLPLHCSQTCSPNLWHEG